MENLSSRLMLRHLRLVHAIHKSGQLSSAAGSLGLTQPAASRTLLELENILGEPLFERHAKGMVPTKIGEVLAGHAGTLIGQFETTVTDIDEFRQGRAGRVRLGAVTGPAVRFGVPAVQKLKSEARLAQVSIDVAPSVELVAGLLRGDYDIVLARVPADVDPRQLDIMRGRVEEICILARRGHPLRRQARLSLDRLAGMVWVIQGGGMPIRQAVEQAFINRDVPVPKNTIDTASLLVTLSYLKTTDAVAAITKEVVELLDAQEAGAWGTLDLEPSITLSPYHAIRVRNRTISPVANRLLELLEAEIAQ